MSISKELFVETIDKIKELHLNSENADEALRSIGIEVDVIINPLEDLVIDLLEASLNDEDSWVQWFIYENDFGARGLKCKSAEGHTIKTDTAEDIYDMITGNPTLLIQENQHKCSCGRGCC